MTQPHRTDEADRARLRLLTGFLTVLERGAEVMDILTSADSRSDAADRIAASLDLPADTARAVLDLQLARFIPSEVDWVRDERNALAGRRPGDPSGPTRN